MKYKHIIWDWNGTLIDDRRFCIDIMNEVLKKRQMETMTEEWFLDNFCFPVKDYYLKLGFNFEKEFSTFSKSNLGSLRSKRFI